MNYDKIARIKAAMMDEKSCTLMDARLEFMHKRDEYQFYKNVDAVTDVEWKCERLKNFLSGQKGEGIIIFGCGHDGRESKRTLDLCHVPVDFFCDSDMSKVGTEVEGIKVIHVDEVIERYSNYSVVLGSRMYYQEMKQILLSKGFPQEQIADEPGLFQAVIGWQYFDVYAPTENEVFVDAGAYNGDTVMDFVKWAGGNYRKIVALEPFAKMCNQVKEQCEKNKMEAVQIIEAAAWNDNEELFLAESDFGGTRVESTGKIGIKGIKIDSIAIGEPVTFLKMDIEGSELKALEGAKNTIKKYKPRLAVCIYHKPEDIVEIPTYILELVPEYKFYIRHYTSNLCETVLYAAVEKQDIDCNKE